MAEFIHSFLYILAGVVLLFLNSADFSDKFLYELKENFKKKKKHLPEAETFIYFLDIFSIASGLV